MKILDLFSGIGGFSLGLERAGMTTVAFCERDPYCREVLAEHWPNVPCHDDVTTREFQEGEADVICGGFPCQDISLAGAGAGLSGERSGLYRELVRAIRLVRPRYAIVENVAALLSRGMGTVLGDMAEIGYDAEWHCIPASSVGAPHRRDRVWIVANPVSLVGDACGTCDASESARGRDAGGGAVGANVANTIGSRLEGRPILAGYIADELAAIKRGGEILVDADSNPSRSTKEPAGAKTGWRSEGFGKRCGGRRHSWSSEPDVGRVAHGVPDRVDRLKGLGNAVVPQIPEAIGRALAQAQGKEP